MDLCVHNYIEETRLAKLTSLQEKFLKHAMNAFPKVKRIVYSTCSLFPEENERVITNVVKTSRTKWRVQDVREMLKGQWNNFGSGMYGSMGSRCMYAKPDKDFTTGFFLAVLDRDQKDFEKCQNRDENIANGHSKETGEVMGNAAKKKKANVDESQGDMQSVNDLEESDDRTSTKKKKRKDKTVRDTETYDVGDGTYQDSNIGDTDAIEVPKKKKKKDKHRDFENTESALNDSSNVEILLEDYVEIKKKKKKRKYANDSLEPILNESQSTEVEETQKKKKNKHKNHDYDIEEKKKSEHVESTITEPIKKKKKKTRDANLLVDGENEN